MKTIRLAAGALFLLGLMMGRLDAALDKDMVAARGTGTLKEYPAGYQAVWNEIGPAMQELDISIAAKDQKEGYFLGDAPGGASDSLVVFVNKVNDSTTKVEIAAIKKGAVPLGQQDWIAPLHEKIAEKIATQEKAK